MELPFYVRATATLVGLVMGVVGLVRALSGASALHAISEGFAVAGLVLFGLLGGVVFLSAVISLPFVKGEERRKAKEVGGLAFVATLAFLGELNNGLLSTTNGVIGALMFTALCSGVVWEARTRYKASRAQCPECAETIMSQARVCKHCGYRRAPRLGAPDSP